MKKINKLMLLLLLFVLVIIGGCDNPRDNVIVEQPNIKDSEWYLLDNISYNTLYSTYGEGQGFFIYDEIDFNVVEFSSNVDKFSVKFDISYGEEQTKIGMGTNGFGNFVFKKAGQYTIKISGKDQDGIVLKEGRFNCNVVVGDRPDKVEFIIKNSNQEIVDCVKGGDSYTVEAKFFNQEKEYIPLKQDCYWNIPGVSQYNLNLGNVFKQEVKKGNLYCYINNNNNKKIRIFDDESLIIYDNLEKTSEFPQGIYYSFGTDVSGGELELNVDAAINGYFYKNIKAEYRFDNGETMPIEMADERSDGKFSINISYGQQPSKIYSIKEYDYSIDNHGNKRSGYFSNGVKYQFEPTKTEAKIYLAVWDLQNKQYAASKIEGTDINLKLVSQAPSAITVTSVSGSHKNDAAAFMTNYKTFNKTPINNTVDVYLCCDMDGDNTILDEYEGKSLTSIKQYFALNISVIGGNLKDYIVSYSYGNYQYPSIQSFESDSTKPFFVAPNIGTATITVKSMFSNHECNLTVNVVNKIFEEAKGIHNMRGDNGYALFSRVDFRNFLRIKEYKLSDYNKDSYVLRNPREDEVFEYSVNGTVVEQDDFSYQNNNIRGQDITVSIKGTSIKTYIYRLYIIPDFKFTVNGVLYCLRELENSREYIEEIYSFDYSNKKWFYGSIPVLNIQGETLDFIITDLLEMENRTDMPSVPRYDYQTTNNKVVVTYLFNYTVNSKTETYRVEILNITLIGNL